MENNKPYQIVYENPSTGEIFERYFDIEADAWAFYELVKKFQKATILNYGVVLEQNQYVV